MNCQRLKKSPAFSFRAPAWRRFRAPALLAAVNARAQREPARPSQRPASSNTVAPTFPPRFAMIILLQPKHCAPAQHKPQFLNNELPIAEALSNNSPSCLRNILASASSMHVPHNKQGKQSKQLSNNTLARKPSWHLRPGQQSAMGPASSRPSQAILQAPRNSSGSTNFATQPRPVLRKARHVPKTSQPTQKHCSKKWYCKKSVSLTRILLQNIIEKNKMKHP